MTITIDGIEDKLKPIKEELEKRISDKIRNVAPEDTDIIPGVVRLDIKYLTENYYSVHGLAVNEKALDSIASAYALGYQRGKSIGSSSIIFPEL